MDISTDGGPCNLHARVDNLDVTFSGVLVRAGRDRQGESAPVLGEEERATIPTHRLLKRQASAAGEFDYGAIGNRASDR